MYRIARKLPPDITYRHIYYFNYFNDAYFIVTTDTTSLSSRLRMPIADIISLVAFSPRIAVIIIDQHFI